MTLDKLYSKDVLRLAAKAHGAGEIAPGASVVTHVNPTCGDRIDLSLAVENGAVSHFIYRIQACLICQASASALGGTILGKGLAEIGALHDALQKMLEQEIPPAAPFDAYGALLPVAQEKSRRSCVMLPIDAALEALEKARQPK